jgi:orotate phosphoribosyltransferase
MSDRLQDYKIEFIRFALNYGVLKLGQFTLKSGRKSPYFIDLGNIATGKALMELSGFYAQALKDYQNSYPNSLISSKERPIILYGPAYKGILLAGALAMKLDTTNDPQDSKKVETPYFYNRKEAKDHGEGGLFVGNMAALNDTANLPIVMVDDVLTAGTAVKQSIKLLDKEKNIPVSRVAALLLAMDRQERSTEHPDLTASLDLTKNYGFPVISIITMDDLTIYLEQLYSGGQVPINDQERLIVTWLKEHNGYEQITQYRKQF